MNDFIHVQVAHIVQNASYNKHLLKGDIHWISPAYYSKFIKRKLLEKCLMIRSYKGHISVDVIRTDLKSMTCKYTRKPKHSLFFFYCLLLFLLLRQQDLHKV